METKKPEEDRRISRRTVIASLGLTGAAMISGGLLSAANGKSSVTNAVYGGDELTADEKIGDVTLMDWLPASVSQGVRDCRDWLNQRAVNPRQPPFNAKFNGVDDDSAAIQSAIVYAQTNQINRVIIPFTPQPARISFETPLVLPSNFVLEGIGACTHFKPIASTSRNFDGAVNNSDEKFIYGRGSVITCGDTATKQTFQRNAKGQNIAIINIHIDGIESEIDKSGLGAKGNHHGIHAQFISGLKIIGCKIKNCLGSGIYCYVVSNAVIEENECSGNGQLPFINSSRNGISIACSDKDVSENVAVRGNLCSHNLNAGIAFGVVNRLSIEGNRLVGNRHKGIEGDSSYASTSATVQQEAVISGNFITDTLMTGLEINSGNNGKISICGNVITNYGCYGILAGQKNNSIIDITGNKVLGGGIYMKGDLTGGSAVVTNVTEIYFWQNKGVGAAIQGKGIPASTTVTAIDAASRTLIMSNAATASSAQTPLYDLPYNAVNITGHLVNFGGNTIIGHAIGHGISVARGYTIRAQSNRVEEVNADGIYIGLNSSQDKEIDVIDIEGNTFKTTGANAVTISVSSASYKVRLVKVSGNHVVNPAAFSASAKYCFQIRSNTSIDSLRLDGNSVADTNALPKAAQGLFLDPTASCARALVTNNDFTQVKNSEIGNSVRITSLKARNNFNISDAG